MTHPRQPFEDSVHDRARGSAGSIGEKADAAGVALAAQVVDRRLH
jgi:hypothetical protein